MTWDEYYLDICNVVAKNSKCLSRQIGSILVRDKSIVSTGYNGPPRGVRRCDQRWFTDKDFAEKYKDFLDKPKQGICPRYVIGFKSGEGLDICPAGHAERNSLINAARHGIKTKGCKMYMSCGIPCTPCLIEIINAGVEEIICTNTDFYDFSAKYVLEESKLKWRLFQV